MRLTHSVLFFVVFIDMLGLGILAPLIPFYAERLGAEPALITLVIATYSLFQFLGTPFWGTMSDRFGRRPVLLVSMAGHVLAYLILANAITLWLLVISRLIGGFTSANLSTAYAYITDTTSEGERAAALGRISAAFGLGFIIGPMLGGWLASISATPEEPNFVLPALVAMGLSLIAVIGVALFVPESAPPADQPVRSRKLLGGFTRSVRQPAIAIILALAFITILFIAAREAVLPLWADAKHGLTVEQIGLVFSVSGLTLTTIQLFLIGRLTRMFGELALVKVALVLFAGGWSGLVLAPSLGWIIAATVLTAAGTALFQTCLQTLLSKRAAAHERGKVMSAYQASSSLARFIGQAGSGSVYGGIGRDAPFLLGAVMMLPALWLAWLIGRRRDNPGAARNDADDNPGGVTAPEIGPGVKAG